MSYNGEIRINTKINNSGIDKGLTDAQKKIKEKLTNELEKTTAVIRKQDVALADLRRQYDALVEGQKTPASLKAMQSSLRDIEREIRETEKANKDLIDQLDKATAQAESFRPFGGEPFDRAAAEVDRLAERLRPVWDKMDGLDAKAKDLRNSIAGVKLTPESSAEAQLLADKISIASDNLEKSKQKASELNNAISNVSSGGAERITTSFNDIARAAQSTAKITANAFKKVGSVLGAIATGVARAAKGIIGMAKNMLTFGNHTKSTTKGITGLTDRLGRLALAALVFNQIRKGLSELAKDMQAVLMANQQFAASWNAIKVNLLTAFAPIWEVIQPAIISFMQLLAQFTAVLARFMALLFGKTYEQAKDSAKAIYDQANATDKLGAAAGKAGKQLAKFDEINRQSEDSAGGAGTDGLDFNIEPPDVSWIDGFANKFKEALDWAKDIWESVWDAFKRAWDNTREYFLSGWNYAIEQVIGLIRKIGDTIKEVFDGADSVGQKFFESFITLLGTVGFIVGDIAKAFSEAWDVAGLALIESFFVMLTDILNLLNSIGLAFREAWNDGTGASIATHILQIFTNINNIISGLAARLHEAWEANGNGVAIWQAILGIVDSVLGFINRISAATVEWVRNLNLEPLVGGFAKLLEALKPLIDLILDRFAKAYEDVLLPFGKWLAEIAVPEALELLTEKIKELTEWLEKNEGAFSNAAVGAGAFLLVVGPVASAISTLASVTSTLMPLITALGGSAGFAGLATAAAPVAAIVAGVGVAIASIAVGIKKGIIPLEDLMIVLKNFGDFFKYVFESVIIPIFDFWKNLFTDGIDAAVKIIGGLVTFLAGVFTGDWSKAWDGIKQAASGALDGFLGLILGMPVRMLAAGVDIIAGLLDGILSKFAGIDNWVKENIVERFIDPIKKFFRISSPSKLMEELGIFVIQGFINGIKSLIDSVAGLFKIAWDGIQNVWKTVSDWFNKNVSEPLQKLFETGTGKIRDFFSNLWDKVKYIWNTVAGWFDTYVIQPVKKAFDSALKAIYDFFNNAWTNIKNIWNIASSWFTTNVITPLRTAFDNALTAIRAFFSNAWDFIKGVWSAVSGWFTTNVITPVKTAFDTALKAIFDFFNNAWTNIKGVWQTVSGWFSTNVIQPVTTVFNGVVESIKKAFDDAWTKAQDVWKGAKRWFEDNVTGPIEKAFGVMRDAVKLIFDKLFGWIEDLLRKLGLVKDEANSAGKGAGGASKSISAFSNIQIPQISRSGIVDSTTIAILAEKGRDAVVTSNRDAEFLNPVLDRLEAIEDALLMMGNRDIVIQSQVGMGEFVRLLRLKLIEENKRAGFRIQPQGVL